MAVAMSPGLDMAPLGLGSDAVNARVSSQPAPMDGGWMRR